MESTGKNTQCKSSNLNLFCFLLRTIAWETDTQIALRNCSEKVVGGEQNICDFCQKVLYNHPHILMEDFI